MRSIMLCNDSNSVHYVYSDEMLAELSDIAGLDDAIYSKEDVLAAPGTFDDVDYAFSTWGMPAFEEEEIRRIFPNMKCVFYGAAIHADHIRIFICIIHRFDTPVLP